MTFEQAFEYLVSTYGNGKKKGLDAMRAALAILGNPQEKLKIIHVAGTNGKGSFCAMMGSVLTEEGYAVGCFTSPHLQTIHERFTINGKMITDEDFARHVDIVARASKQLFGTEDTFSYFEVLTLMAFSYFREKNVDMLLLEVGIGGRLDATNVIKSPLLAVIMAIGMDHMEILGDTIDKIAGEKAGIIKENCPVVLCNGPRLVYNIIADIAMTKSAKIYPASDVAADVLESDVTGTKFIAYHEYFGKILIKLGLMGQYQLKNALCVIEAFVALNETGLKISAESLQKGLSQAKWPGRMEIVSENPTVILEGAHNLQGAQAAAENICNIFGGKEITLLMGILNDKEYGEIVKVLADVAGKIVLTKPLYDLRAASPAELAEVLKECDKEVFAVENCKDALEKAIEITGDDGVIFCSGSLYLVGDIREIYKGEAK